MTGSSIFDYIHQQDHAEIAEHLGLSLAGRGGAGLNSPASGSEEGSQHGTNNPDGMFKDILPLDVEMDMETVSAVGYGMFKKTLHLDLETYMESLRAMVKEFKAF